MLIARLRNLLTALVMRSTRGQAIVLVAAAMVILVGFTGLTVDYGFWLVRQRELRAAADAAAQAGASEVSSLPVASADRAAAAEHAMLYLNEQMHLGFTPAQIQTAATHAIGDADGFGAEDEPSFYTGADRFTIRSPSTATNSCTGQTWGTRSVTVRIDHQAPRFFSRIFFGDTQAIEACATSAVRGRGYAVAVLEPNANSGTPQGPNVTMKLAGTNSFVLVCGGDVGVNSLFRGGPAPPNPLVDPAFVKFLNANTAPVPCDIDNENRMFLTLDQPFPPAWAVVPPQVRGEGAASGTADDPYLKPEHLPTYIEIPDWGAAEYAALSTADAADPNIVKSGTDAGGATTCSPPAGYDDAVDPGKYSLLQVDGGASRWLCPGVYHFTKRPGTFGLDFGNDGTIGGQGVTLVFENDSRMFVDNNAALLLNSAAAGGSLQSAPWKTTDPEHPDVPIAVYVEPFTCGPVPTLSCASSSVFNMQAGSGIFVRGIIFGPTDNMKIAGNGTHAGAGEVWAWTLEYKGTSALRQDYEGSSDGYPVLVE